MRRKLRKALELSWKEAMKAEFPDFAPYKAETMPETFSCWRGKIGVLTCFVTLHPHTKDDVFAIDLAWSVHGFLSPDDTLQPEGAEEIRLARLWTTSTFDPWWEIVPRESWEEMNKRIDEGRFFREEVPIEECLVKVPILVRDAIEKLKQYGIPFFMAKAQAAVATT